MNITVVGMGYVGLSNALLLSKVENVTGFDTNEEKIKLLNRKISPIKDSLIEDYLKCDEDIRFTQNADYSDCDLCIVCVPTNYDEKKDYFDTSILDYVIEDINKKNKNTLILIKSTIPVGYCDDLKKRLDNENILFSPEFLREGRALFDSLNPTRMIFSPDNKNARKLAKLYEQAIYNNPKVFFMETKEAESVKLFANTYLAMRVAFFNELDTFASINNLNTKNIIDGISSDDRIGEFYNNPSFGYGGYCLPKDTKQLLSNFKDVPNDLIAATVKSNDTRKEYIAKSILEKKVKKVGIYRLVMKSGSDNFRKSAIFDIINKLKASDVSIEVYEPTIESKTFMDLKINNNLDLFLENELIIANRMDDILKKHRQKVFTKDVFNRD